MATVRDRLWLWGHPANAHGMATKWKVPGESRITPVEAAVYMGIPNVQMVWLWRAHEPEPLPSWKQYALPLNGMKEVVWGVSHGHGLSYTDKIFPIVKDAPNVTGVLLDDFFTPQKDGRFTAVSEEGLVELRERMAEAGKRLDLWCVVYEQDLPKPIGSWLEKMDVLAYYMWNTPSVPHMEEHLDALDKLAPTKPKHLGLYLWDYPQAKPISLDLVKFQSETALKLLKQGRIEGISIVASCICDLEIEAVEWTREWIARVGGEELGR